MTKLILSPCTSGLTYNVKVSATNDVGTTSSLSSPQSVVISAYSTTPGVPTSVTCASNALGLIVTFTNTADKDLKGVELWYATASAGSFSLYDSLDGVPGQVSQFNLNFKSSIFSLDTTYFFKLRSINTSGVYSAYTAETSGSWNTVNTGQVTVEAITTVHTSIVASSVAGLSSTADSITYSSNGGVSTSTLQGLMIATITLGTVPSSVVGFQINANAMASKRTMGTTEYAYALPVQKIEGETYWEVASGSGGTYAVFLGTGDATGMASTEGIQGNYSTSFTDDATDVIGTTGTQYGLFLYETTETTAQYWIFGGTGMTVTELKR